MPDGTRLVTSGAGSENDARDTGRAAQLGLWLDYLQPPGAPESLSARYPPHTQLPLTMPGHGIALETTARVLAYGPVGPRQRYGRVKVAGLGQALCTVLLARTAAAGRF